MTVGLVLCSVANKYQTGTLHGGSSHISPLMMNLVTSLERLT